MGSLADPVKADKYGHERHGRGSLAAQPGRTTWTGEPETDPPWSVMVGGG
jgi:hypothetical protein